MSLLDSLSIVWVFVGTLVFILFFFEAGFQLGKFMQPRYTKQGDSVSLPMVGSLLAMLAFVLAITFSMVASRFDERKSNVLAEVNAIKTAYTRADLLAEPHGSGVKRLLREYVDVRLLAIDRAAREDALSRSIELQDRLWAEVNSSLEDNPTRLSALVVQSVNLIKADSPGICGRSTARHR